MIISRIYYALDGIIQLLFNKPHILIWCYAHSQRDTFSCRKRNLVRARRRSRKKERKKDKNNNMRNILFIHCTWSSFCKWETESQNSTRFNLKTWSFLGLPLNFFSLSLSLFILIIIPQHNRNINNQRARYSMKNYDNRLQKHTQIHPSLRIHECIFFYLSEKTLQFCL